MLRKLITITKLFLSAILIFSSLLFYGQTKHGLVITISNYPAESGWSIIHSDNDKKLIEQMLFQQGFLYDNIIFLENKRATHHGIAKGFIDLINNIQKDDIVYIHYSGHGQQIMDIGDIDEGDGYDEAIAAYDSPKIWKEGYDGKSHFRDDEINVFIQKIRKKLGKKGQIIIVFDSCHSGSGNRGDSQENFQRGSGSPCAPNWYIEEKMALIRTNEDYDVETISKANYANVAYYAGCRSDQINHEYFDFANKKWYGSLSFHFENAIRLLDSNATHRNLFAMVRDGYFNNVRTRIQEPELEADNKDELIFNGQILKQKPFFELNNINGENVVIEGGSVHGLIKDDSIGFFDNVAASNENKELFGGRIVKVDLTTSEVLISDTLAILNIDKAKYRAFITARAKTPETLLIKLEIKNPERKEKLLNYLISQKHYSVVKNNYEYILRDGINETVEVVVAANELMNSFVSFAENEQNALEGLNKNLNKLIRLKSFMDVIYDNPNIKLEIENIPKGIKVNSEKDTLIIGNKGTKEVYLYFFYVGPDMNPILIPREESNYYYHLIEPNKDVRFPLEFTCSEKDPCGLSKLKLISSNSAISGIENLLEMSTENYGVRGKEGSGLLQYFDSKLMGSRGGEKPDVETINFYFEIQSE